MTEEKGEKNEKKEKEEKKEEVEKEKKKEEVEKEKKKEEVEKEKKKEEVEEEEKKEEMEKEKEKEKEKEVKEEKAKKNEEKEEEDEMSKDDDLRAVIQDQGDAELLVSRGYSKLLFIHLRFQAVFCRYASFCRILLKSFSCIWILFRFSDLKVVLPALIIVFRIHILIFKVSGSSEPVILITSLDPEGQLKRDHAGSGSFLNISWALEKMFASLLK